MNAPMHWPAPAAVLCVASILRRLLLNKSVDEHD
jgi:hypothetical protein